MSAASPAVSSQTRPVTSAPTRSLVPALARQEARRLMRHPLTLLGFAVFALNAVLGVFEDLGPRSAFETVSMVLSFYPGVMLVLAANLVAGRDGRAHSDEMLAPLPGRREERVTALLIASLAPAAVGLAGVLALHAFYLVDGRYAVAPNAWHLVTGPVTLVGACAFGTMLAVWLPYRGAAVVGLVALVAFNVATDPWQEGRLFGMVTPWARWGDFAEQWAGIIPGSPGWHVVYLAGLSGMAAAAAVVRVADRRRPVVLAGLAAVLVTVLAGIWQLP